MTLNELRGLLWASSLDDILVGGFIDDEEDPVQFRAMLNVTYFDFGGTLVEVRAVESAGSLIVTPVTRVQPQHLKLDDDMQYAVSSLQEVLLQDPDADCTLTSVRLWNAEARHGCVHCAALEIVLASGQELFVDPTFHFGMRIGDGELRSIWKSNWPWAKDATESVLDLTPRRG